MGQQEIAMTIAIEPLEAAESLEDRSSLASPIQLCQVECHYCSFEPADHEHLPARCPKCGGSAWERYVLRGGMLLIGGDSDSAEVEFKLHCPAVCAYLFGDLRPNAPRMIEMTHTAPDDWSTTLSLPPGRYSYQFYVHDGRLVFCVTPAQYASMPGMGHSFVAPQRRDAAATPKTRRDWRTSCSRKF
jgi:hypothetical protein